MEQYRASTSIWQKMDLSPLHGSSEKGAEQRKAKRREHGGRHAEKPRALEGDQTGGSGGLCRLTAESEINIFCDSGEGIYFSNVLIV